MLDAGQRRLRLQAGKAAHPWENTEQGVTLPWLRDPYSPRYASSCRQRCSAVTGHIGWPAMPRWPELQTNDRSVCGDPRRLRSQVAKRRRVRISTALRPRRAGAAEGVGTAAAQGPHRSVTVDGAGHSPACSRLSAPPPRRRACVRGRPVVGGRRSAAARSPRAPAKPPGAARPRDPYPRLLRSPSHRSRYLAQLAFPPRSARKADAPTRPHTRGAGRRVVPCNAGRWLKRLNLGPLRCRARAHSLAV